MNLRTSWDFDKWKKVPFGVIKHGLYEVFNRKIIDVYGPFSSKPCLMTRGWDFQKMRF